MTSQREKRVLTRISRLFVFALGCLSIFTEGLVADVVSVAALGCWLYLPLMVKVEQKLLHMLGGSL